MTTDLTAHIPAWIDGKLCPVGKLETHQRGLRHPAVSVMIMSGSQMLIQRRALGKYHTPGLWANACCTHPFWGEDPQLCAERRLDEELGIDGLTLNHRANLEYRADVGNGLIEHEVVDLFVAWPDASLRITPNPEEVMDWRWVEIEALANEIEASPTDFTPWFKIYLNDYAETLIR
jgi:isopentenyl-diphosphate Delta-isomerase